MHEQPVLCFDLDGTLCDDRYPDIGAPRHEMLAFVETLHRQGYYLIINSARRSLDYDRVRAFLERHAVAYDQLCLGAKPVADLYIDDKGLLAEPRLLEMLVERRFQPEYLNNLASEQLTSAFARNVYDVPEAGGGLKRDSRFMVGLAMTGGLDSTTMWNMLEEAGTPYRMVYFDMGQPYAAAELKAIRDITGRDPELYQIPLPFVQHTHMLSGRNAVILWQLAELLTQHGGWGELWFGNVQGESPVLGGDKSRRFLNDMTALFAFSRLDVRLVTPLLGLDKTDEILYWKERDMTIAKRTKSCFAAETGQCGRCQACFLKWAAFVAADVDCADVFPVMEFDTHVAKYMQVMGEALIRRDFSHYSPQRIERTLKAVKVYETMRTPDGVL